jgi:hypothetical protein
MKYSIVYKVPRPCTRIQNLTFFPELPNIHLSRAVSEIYGQTIQYKHRHRNANSVITKSTFYRRDTNKLFSNIFHNIMPSVRIVLFIRSGEEYSMECYNHYELLYRTKETKAYNECKGKL